MEYNYLFLVFSLCVWLASYYNLSFKKKDRQTKLCNRNIVSFNLIDCVLLSMDPEIKTILEP